GWRETGGALAARTMTTTDLSSAVAPVNVVTGVASNAVLTLAPRSGGTLFALIDRGTANNVVRSAISATLVAGIPVTTLGTSAPNAMAGLPTGRTLSVLGPATDFGGPLTVFVHDAAGTQDRMFTLGSAASKPAVAAGAM